MLLGFRVCRRFNSSSFVRPRYGQFLACRRLFPLSRFFPPTLDPPIYLAPRREPSAFGVANNFVLCRLPARVVRRPNVLA